MKITGTATAIVTREEKTEPREFEVSVTLPDDSAPQHVNAQFHQLHQQLHNLASNENGAVQSISLQRS